MARGSIVFVSMLLGVMSGCSSDAAAPGVAQVSEAGVEAGADEGGNVIDMPGDGPVSSCTDGIKNGGESDVDCGGICSQCVLHKDCHASSDCASNRCVETKCLECAPNNHQCSGNKTSSCVVGMWVVANDDCAGGCDLDTGVCITGSE